MRSVYRCVAPPTDRQLSAARSRSVLVLHEYDLNIFCLDFGDRLSRAASFVAALAEIRPHNVMLCLGIKRGAALQQPNLTNGSRCHTTNTDVIDKALHWLLEVLRQEMRDIHAKHERCKVLYQCNIASERDARVMAIRRDRDRFSRGW
jgi:hypothetical protein